MLYDFELIRFNDTDVSIDQGEGENRVDDLAHITQYLSGQGDSDIFVIDRYEQDYDWASKLDGQGTVVWSASGHDLLYGFERLRFIDGETELAPVQPAASVVTDDASQTQYLAGQSERDVFRLDGARADFGWGKTNDGGYVVWNLESKAHDLLYGFESLEFEDSEIDFV